MAQPIQMPKLGQSVETCTIVKWRKQVGDAVKKGDILFEIETEKAVLEVESFYEGTLLKILVPEGEAAPVTAVVAYVGKPGEPVPDAAPVTAAAANKDTEMPKHAGTAPRGEIHPHPGPLPSREREASGTATAPFASTPAVAAPSPAQAQTPVAAEPGKLRISPRARALARDAAIDPSRIAGSGPEGRIVEKDVRAWLVQHHYADLRVSPAAKNLAVREQVDILTVAATGEAGRIMVGDVERAIAERPKPLSRMRQVIAQRLTQSVTTQPHFYVTVSVDMGTVLQIREEARDRGQRFSVTDFILEACVLSLQEYPAVNSSTDGRAVRWHSRVHLGMATSVPDGLVVPVIRDAQTLTMAELHAAATALAIRARDGKLTPDEMTGSTFTVSNMGMLHVESFTAIINPGEAAILAVSSTIDTPVARDGRVVVRPIMKITLSSDHRLIDGVQAARFANAIKHKLEDATLWTRLIS